MERIFRSIDPKENRFRFYSMHIEKSLFGDFTLTCAWGRIGTRGQCRISPFDSKADCLTAMKQIAKVRKQHGYDEINE